jgi:threonine/homoserine/homoserine lactone efflux protein
VKAVASLAGIVAATLLISPSGALSPGPLSTSAVIMGARGRGAREGFLVAAGHMAFELPYVYLLVRSFGSISSSPGTQRMLTLVSAGFIFLFAALTLRDAVRGARPDTGGSGPIYGSFATGVILTGLNPFFLAWWPSVAMPIIREAALMGAAGFAAMYASHVWYDFAWLGFLGYAGRKGTEALEGRIYGALLAGFAALLLVFGADMLARSFAGRAVLPF